MEQEFFSIVKKLLSIKVSRSLRMSLPRVAVVEDFHVMIISAANYAYAFDI